MDLLWIQNWFLALLIGKPALEFSLNPVLGRKFGLAKTDIKGEVSMVGLNSTGVSKVYQKPLLSIKTDASPTST